jgi:hypothetical protein
VSDTTELAQPVAIRIASRVRAYVLLTKPRVIELLLVTTLPAMVLAAGKLPSFTLMGAVLVTLEDGTQIWYCHQSATLVRTGENVEIAQPVGLVGSTGNSTGPHLHLEVRPEGGPAIDPMPWFAAHGIEF